MDGCWVLTVSWGVPRASELERFEICLSDRATEPGDRSIVEKWICRPVGEKRGMDQPKLLTMWMLLLREKMEAGGEEKAQWPGPGEETLLPHPYPRALWSPV